MKNLKKLGLLSFMAIFCCFSINAMNVKIEKIKQDIKNIEKNIENIVEKEMALPKNPRFFAGRMVGGKLVTRTSPGWSEETEITRGQYFEQIKQYKDEIRRLTEKIEKLEESAFKSIKQDIEKIDQEIKNIEKNIKAIKEKERALPENPRFFASRMVGGKLVTRTSPGWSEETEKTREGYRKQITQHKNKIEELTEKISKIKSDALTKNIIDMN